MSGRRRKGGGCLTVFLAFVAVLMLALAAVVGWFYLKDTGWLETRAALTGGRKASQAEEPAGPVGIPADAGTNRESAAAKPAVVERAVRTVETRRSERRRPRQTVRGPQRPSAAVEAPVKRSPSVRPAVPQAAKPVRPAAVEAGPRTVTLYFLRYDERSGRMMFAPVTRSQPASATPLLDTLRLLFLGPSEAEEAREITSAIPGGVRVLSATVKDGVAVIDLSPEFASGTGREVMLARVYQVVYTATQYETVRSVRILVGGKTVRNLGGEGVDLSAALARTLREPVRF